MATKSKKKVNKWGQESASNVHMDWHKTDSQTTRRRRALKAHKGDYLAAGRALQRIANLTADHSTKVKARCDAHYFFDRHAQTK